MRLRSTLVAGAIFAALSLYFAVVHSGTVSIPSLGHFALPLRAFSENGGQATTRNGAVKGLITGPEVVCNGEGKGVKPWDRNTRYWEKLANSSFLLERVKLDGCSAVSFKIVRDARPRQGPNSLCRQVCFDVKEEKPLPEEMVVKAHATRDRGDGPKSAGIREPVAKHGADLFINGYGEGTRLLCNTRGEKIRVYRTCVDICEEVRFAFCRNTVC